MGKKKGKVAVGGDQLKRLYREDIERVAKGESPLYFGSLADKPLENEYPEFNLPLPPMGKVASRKALGFSDETIEKVADVIGDIYDFTGKPNKFIKEGLDRIKETLPESKKKVFENVRKYLTDVHDHGLALFAKELTYQDEPEKKPDGGLVGEDREVLDLVRKMYREDMDRTIKGEEPMYFRGMAEQPLVNVYPESFFLGRVPVRRVTKYVTDKGVGAVSRSVASYGQTEEDQDQRKAEGLYPLGYVDAIWGAFPKDYNQEKRGYSSYLPGGVLKDGGSVGDDKMVVYDDIYDYLTTKKNIPQDKAVAMVANIAAESGGNTSILGAAGDFGIQQWLGARKEELHKRYGKSPDLYQQLDYLVDEYKGNVPGLGWNYMDKGKFFDKDKQGNEYNYYMYSRSEFDNAPNYKDATIAWNQGFGRPLGSTLRNDKRMEIADVLADRYGLDKVDKPTYAFGTTSQDPVTDGSTVETPPAAKLQETAASSQSPALADSPSGVSSGIDRWWMDYGADLQSKLMTTVLSEVSKITRADKERQVQQDNERKRLEDEAEREEVRKRIVMSLIPNLKLNIKRS